MTPTEFRDRLETVARRTGLTASDLAVWFGRPRPTVRTWLHGTKPQSQIGGHIWDELAQRLIWLERAFAAAPDGYQPKRSFLKELFNRERLRSVRQSAPRVAGNADF